MHTSTGSYRYDPLNTSNHEFRLIHLQHASDLDQLIECSLVAANLDEAGLMYEALSYEWGPDSGSGCHISLNGIRCPVRENLWWAFRHLRLVDRPRVLWVDVLCINQSDLEERNHQVRQMGEIYSGCKRVVAWIGRAIVVGDSNEDFSIDFLQSLNSNSDEALKGKQRTSPPQIVQLEALLGLCQRRYWRRLWIIQELVLAPSVLVQCGHRTFDLNCFSYIDSSLLRPLDYAVRSKIMASLPIKLIALRQDEGGEMSPLLSIMQETSDANCADLRDKAFGLLNLSMPCCRQAVQPDYSKSLEEVCGLIFDHHLAWHTDRPHVHHAWPYRSTKNIPLLMKKLLQGLGLALEKRIGQLYPNPPAISPHNWTGEKIFKVSASYQRIAWLFHPHSSRFREADIPFVPDVCRPAVEAVLNAVKHGGLKPRFIRGEPLEGEQLFFHTESEFKPLLRSSKVWLWSPLLPARPSGVLARTAPWTDPLQQNWRHFICSRVDSIIAQDLSIFITEENRVGYSSSDCKIGDLVCETGTDDRRVAVARDMYSPLDDRTQVIGKAVLLSYSPELLGREGKIEVVRTGKIKASGKADRWLEMDLCLAHLFYLYGYF